MSLQTGRAGTAVQRTPRRSCASRTSHALPCPGRGPAPAVGTVQAVDGVDLRARAGRDARAWSASPAAARRRRAAWSSGCSNRRRPDLLPRHRPVHDGRGGARAVARKVQIVFQDPYASLSPRMTVHDIVAEPLRIQGQVPPRRRRPGRRAARPGRAARRARRPLRPRVLRRSAPTHRHRAVPGPRPGPARARRAGFARSTCRSRRRSSTSCAVLQRHCGWPTSSSPTICRSYGTCAHRIAVMYLGGIVEIGTRDRDLRAAPQHPYTQALLSAVPVPDPRLRRQSRTDHPRPATCPSPSDPPSGCRFRTRCWKSQQRCADEVPVLQDRLSIGHPSACHFPEPIRWSRRRRRRAWSQRAVRRRHDGVGRAGERRHGGRRQRPHPLPGGRRCHRRHHRRRRRACRRHGEAGRRRDRPRGLPGVRRHPHALRPHLAVRSAGRQQDPAGRHHGGGRQLRPGCGAARRRRRCRAGRVRAAVSYLDLDPSVVSTWETSPATSTPSPRPGPSAQRRDLRPAPAAPRAVLGLRRPAPTRPRCRAWSASSTSVSTVRSASRPAWSTPPCATSRCRSCRAG